MFTFNWGKLGESIQREALELSQLLFYNLGLSLSCPQRKRNKYQDPLFKIWKYLRGRIPTNTGSHWN